MTIVSLEYAKSLPRTARVSSWLARPIAKSLEELCADYSSTERTAIARSMAKLGARSFDELLASDCPEKTLCDALGIHVAAEIAESLRVRLNEVARGAPQKPSEAASAREEFLAYARGADIEDVLQDPLRRHLTVFYAVAHLRQQLGPRIGVPETLDEVVSVGFLERIGDDARNRLLPLVKEALVHSAAARREEVARALLEDAPLEDPAGFAELDEALRAAIQGGRASRAFDATYSWHDGEQLLSVRLHDDSHRPPIEVPIRLFRLGARCFRDVDPSALRATRRLLRMPDVPAFRELAAWLTTPAHVRVLSRLGVATDELRTADAPRDSQLAFRLEGAGSERSVSVLQQKRSKKGTFTPGRTIEAHRLRDCMRFAEPYDLDALRVLSEAERNYGRTDAETTLAETLEALVGHPRVLSSEGHVAVRKLPLSLEFVESPSGLSPWLRFGPHLRELATLSLLSKDGIAVEFDDDRRQVLVGRLPKGLRQVVAALMREPVTFPHDAYDSLLAHLEKLGDSAPVCLPPRLEGERDPDGLRPTLTLSLDGEGALFVVLDFRTPSRDGRFTPSEGAPRVYYSRDGQRRHILRDLDAEKALADEILAGLGLPDVGRPVGERNHAYAVAAGEDMLTICERASRLGDRVDLLWATEKVSVVGHATTKNLSVTVRSAGAYLSVGGNVAIEGAEVTLSTVLASIREGRRFVEVGRGQFIRLAESLISDLSPLAELGTPSTNALALTPLALPLLDAIFVEVGQHEVASELQRRFANMREAAGEPAAPPRHLKETLRPYQLDGYRWLMRLAAWSTGAVLADDMGLGKTVQAIALLETRSKAGPALVVAPTSVVPNWEAELGRFGKKLRPRTYVGHDRSEQLETLSAHDLLLTTWDIAVRDADKLSAIAFCTAVFDEAQVAKNPATQRAAMARAIRADFKLLLSGTPIENNLTELWSHFSVALPGLLGGVESFRKRFAVPIERDRDTHKRETLARVVAPFTLRRVKEAVERDLPPLTEVTRWVDLSPAERSLYESARRLAVSELETKVDDPKSRLSFLTWLTKLRQLACHAKLFDATSALTSSKLESFLDLADTLVEGGHPALVFSQFTRHLALVEDALRRRGYSFQYLDGAVTMDERRRRVDAFQEGKGDFFLISLKAGGIGLNLTRATYVVHLDPWWNPAAEDQATDRAHRIGQAHPVTVVRLVSRGTVEEAIVSVRESKRELADAVLAGTDAAGKLSGRELLALVRRGVDQATGRES